MTYTKQVWADNDVTKPLSAARMNYIETGIETANTGPTEARRNLIDNGAMNVCQRPASLAGINSVNGVRVTDRWYMSMSGGPVWTISNQTTGGPAGTGLTRSQKWLCTTADASPAAGQYTLQVQAIEGQFLQHLLWGTASAKSLTLSFWVKSNKTGTYIAELAIATANTFYNLAYTISAADTWEQKTLTFPGNTATGLVDDASGQLYLNLWLHAGTTYTSGASLNAWTTTTNKRAVGQVNLAAAINNYLQITGIQLEVSSVATAFEFRRYSDELFACRRYFRNPVAPEWRGQWHTTTTGIIRLTWDPAMRGAPSIVIVAGPYTNWLEMHGAAFLTPTVMTGTASGINYARIDFTTGATTAMMGALGSWPADAVMLSAEI